ncbi:MAG: nicotinamidase-like amidase [Actinomycetia bacterium]|nr:nicotinamidase-like amidase [Actinomycetes bacterium]
MSRPYAGTSAATGDAPPLRLLEGPLDRRAAPGPASEAAVLVVDIQRGFADPELLPWVPPESIGEIDAAIRSANRLVAAARGAGVPVVWVRLVQHRESPWHASDWFRGYEGDEHGPCVAGTGSVDWFGVAPGDGELVVDKHRYNGFLDTPLESMLREMGVTWFVACGLSTECCVESTVRGGFELGFRAVVAADACAAWPPELHTGALRSMAANYALVADVDAIVATIT